MSIQQGQSKINKDIAGGRTQGQENNPASKLAGTPSSEIQKSWFMLPRSSSQLQIHNVHKLARYDLLLTRAPLDCSGFGRHQ
jgi:hypothetical protein